MLPAGCPLFLGVDFHHHDTATVPSSSSIGQSKLAGLSSAAHAE